MKNLSPADSRALVAVLTEIRELLVDIKSIVSKSAQVEKVVDNKTREEMHKEKMGTSLRNRNRILEAV